MVRLKKYPKNGSYSIHALTLRRAQDSVGTGWRNRHPFGEGPFALSAAVAAAVEGAQYCQLPFLGLWS